MPLAGLHILSLTFGLLVSEVDRFMPLFHLQLLAVKSVNSFPNKFISLVGLTDEWMDSLAWQRHDST